MKILLVCSGNTCRSPMAEALLKQLLAERVPSETVGIRSAGIGTVAGMPASPHAVAAMKERGLDIGHHRSQPVTRELVAESDLVLTMTGYHREAIRHQWPEYAGKVFTLAEYVGRADEVPDPFGGSLAEYRCTAESLAELLAAVVQQMSQKENGEA
jgi:protein-tyrosine-phosphatase